MRELTQLEAAAVEAAWKQYLDVATNATEPGQISEAWQKYQAELKRLGVSSTLAGYKVYD